MEDAHSLPSRGPASNLTSIRLASMEAGERSTYCGDRPRRRRIASRQPQIARPVLGAAEGFLFARQIARYQSINSQPLRVLPLDVMCGPVRRPPRPPRCLGLKSGARRRIGVGHFDQSFSLDEESNLSSRKAHTVKCNEHLGNSLRRPHPPEVEGTSRD